MSKVIPFGAKVDKDGQPPHDGGMEARVAKLEADSEYIKRDIGELKTDVKAMLARLGSIDSTLSGMNEKLDRFPTKLQLALWIIGGLATLLVGAAGLIAFLLRLSGHPGAADALNSVRGK